MSNQEVFTEINRKTATILGLCGIANDRTRQAKRDRTKEDSEQDWHMQVGLFPSHSKMRIILYALNFLSSFISNESMLL